MKLPDDNVNLIKLLDQQLTQLGMSSRYIAQVKQDIAAHQQWIASDQQFILAYSFASGGGVKAPNGTAVSRPGVYKYIYLPTEDCVYTGWSSNLYNRTATAKKVAKSIIATGKPPLQTIYCGVEKMMVQDRNLKNWIIYYMETFSIDIAKEEEKRIIFDEKPQFNDPNMAGK